MTYTKGPWEACAWSGHAATTVKAGDVVVAECAGHGRHSDESIADARLIAASPDLYEALKGIFAYRQFMIDLGGAKGPLPQHVIEQLANMQRDVFDVAEAALAKAEGKQ